MRVWSVAVAVAVVLGVQATFAQRFHRDDPMLVDDDRLVDVSREPAELELSDLFDRFGHIFGSLGDPPFPAFLEAQNVNTLDEVPDSSWFINRHGRSRLSREELMRGANVDGPPNPDETWTIFAGKSQGITPGFSIEDEQGDRYVIKFDPVDVPELSTAAEIIGTKLFHALGYYVPQNYIVHVDPARFAIRPGTMVRDRFGDATTLTMQHVRQMIRRVPRDGEGRMRVMASKYIEGVPLGPFRYYGTRADDPNDVVPHEHRRELRGLRLFAAWANHDDTRAQNTQTSWVEHDGKHHVRHWLMDFGSTFGSGSVEMQLANLGFGYWMDLGDMRRNAFGFGFRVPAYRRVQWPPYPEFEAVGRWEGEAFDPLAWRNDYPNPAFIRMSPRDAFWAARIIMSFTPDDLLAIVKTGQFSSPEHERYFHDVLVKRQRKSGAAGINMLNPLGEFRIAGGVLEFSNLSERYGFVQAGSTSYDVEWSLFDNTASETREVIAPASGGGTGTRLSIPESLRYMVDSNTLLAVEIASRHPDYPEWAWPVRVFLRWGGQAHEVVGIERESPQAYVDMS